MSFTCDTLVQHIERPELDSLIPHSKKMLLLSRVISWDLETSTIVTEYDITKDCIFYDEELDGIPSYAGFEIMAQGISVLGSIRRITDKNNEPPKSGVVLSITGYKADREVLKCGTTIRMKVSEDFSSDNVFKYSCMLFENKDSAQPCVITEVTVMEMKNINSFFSA